MTPTTCAPDCPGWAVFNVGESGTPKGEIQRCDTCAALARDAGRDPLDDVDAARLAEAAGYRTRQLRDGTFKITSTPKPET